MKYPMINKQAKRTINVPKLLGGTNLRDSLTGVRDNQLTECVNMWNKGGILRTRPPMVTTLAKLMKPNESLTEQKITTHFHNDIKVKYGGFDCVCATNKRVITNPEDESVTCSIDFEFHSNEKSFAMPSITGIDGGDDITYFLSQMPNIIYCYVSNKTIWRLKYNNNSAVESLYWKRINLSESYVPTVMTHCKARKVDGQLIYTGTQLESYNALTNSFKMVFSTVNLAGLVDGKINAEYPLIAVGSLSLAYNSYIKVRHTTVSGVVAEHGLLCPFEEGRHIWYESDTVSELPKDSLYLYVKIYGNKIEIGFSDKENSDVPKQLTENDFVEDNLEITVLIPSTKNLDLKKVFGMQKTMWFGGTSSGIYGGSRLFLCGNEAEDERSLIVWSGLNNPLYFPENCYAYVGNKNSAVTAFGRQNDKLIIFKENEMYYTYYVYNDNITADDLLNQSVIDYEANVAYFPMMLLNPYIGCDCPDSVQMCSNRLVWARSDGKVYTLCKINQYDEHNIYEISGMIDTKLKEYKEQLKTSTSADFAGHYVLFLNDCAFVADYNSYGYQNISSYSKTEDANTLLPWYYWEFSFLKNDEETDRYECAKVCALGETLLMRAYFNASDDTKSCFIGFRMSENEYSAADTVFINDLSDSNLQLNDNAINSVASTKVFELGDGIYNVNIESVDLKLGANNGEQINVTAICNCGSENIVIAQQREDKSIKAVDFCKTKRIYPSMKAVLKLGIRLECLGKLAIDGVVIRYRMLGGAK